MYIVNLYNIVHLYRCWHVQSACADVDLYTILSACTVYNIVCTEVDLYGSWPVQMLDWYLYICWPVPYLLGYEILLTCSDVDLFNIAFADVGLLKNACTDFDQLNIAYTDVNLFNIVGLYRYWPVQMLTY